MNKELEALLLTACKTLGMGAVGVRGERAENWGVPVARFVRAGERVHPQCSEVAETSGYYLPSRGESLGLEADNPGDGWTRYSLFVYGPDTTGVRHFRGHSGVLDLKGMKTLLRGIALGATK